MGVGSGREWRGVLRAVTAFLAFVALWRVFGAIFFGKGVSTVGVVRCACLAVEVGRAMMRWLVVEIV